MIMYFIVFYFLGWLSILFGDFLNMVSVKLLKFYSCFCYFSFVSDEFLEVSLCIMLLFCLVKSIEFFYVFYIFFGL